MDIIEKFLTVFIFCTLLNIITYATLRNKTLGYKNNTFITIVIIVINIFLVVSVFYNLYTKNN